MKAFLALFVVCGVAVFIVFGLRGCGPDASELFTREVDQDLAEAAARGDTAGINAALAAGANINAVGTNGVHPLDYAYRNFRNVIGFEHLLKCGADPNLTDDQGKCIVNYSAREPVESEWLRVALEHGGDPNIRWEGGETIRTVGSTPVWDAVSSNNVANLELLVEYGANINALDDENGYSPVLFAAVGRHPQMGRWLLEHGADWTHLTNGGIGLAEAEIRQQYESAEFPELAEAHQWILDFLEDQGVDLIAAEVRSREIYGDNFRPIENPR